MQGNILKHQLPTNKVNVYNAVERVFNKEILKDNITF